MTIDHQRQSIHYFHMYAALDRISCTGLQNNKRVGEVMSLNASVFLPLVDDSQRLCTNYARLLGRLLVQKLKYVTTFKQCVDHHILHRYSNEMTEIYSGKHNTIRARPQIT